MSLASLETLEAYSILDGIFDTSGVASLLGSNRGFAFVVTAYAIKIGVLARAKEDNLENVYWLRLKMGKPHVSRVVAYNKTYMFSIFEPVMLYTKRHPSVICRGYSGEMHTLMRFVSKTPTSPLHFHVFRPIRIKNKRKWFPPLAWPTP